MVSCGYLFNLLAVSMLLTTGVALETLDDTSAIAISSGGKGEYFLSESFLPRSLLYL